jgi:hypothetical protein
MKLNIAPTPVERVGVVTESKDFGIKSTAKAFQVLSSKLYKNKIAAVIRELSANAYDSHVAVWRNDYPFEVHLPTAFEPYFSIRDFGTGLTHTAVGTIFTTFFESTKEGSNDFIGALGLGCKSPFSYVDSFVVYTFDGTNRRTYECFVENGQPKLAHKATVPSNEECGVEISMAVQLEDCATFAAEAAAIYLWFKVRPTITGNTLAIPEYPALRGSCWSVAPNGFHAIMGQVRYPIDPQIVGTSLKNLIVHFDIGEIDVQAGREELSYDKTTIAAIQQRLVLVEAEIRAEYKKLFRGCKNVFEANVRVERSKDQKMFSILTPTWQGLKITGRLSEALKDVARHNGFGDKEDLSEALPSEMVIFMMDVERTAMKRFNIWHKTTGAVGYQITPLPGVTVEDAMEPFGDLTIIRASSIALPPNKAKLRTMTRYTNYEIRQKGDRNIDLDAGGVFLMSKNLNAIHPHPEKRSGSYPTISHTLLEPLHRLMINELYSSPERPDGIADVVIIPWSRLDEMEGNWTHVYDLLNDLYKKHRKDKTWRAQMLRARHYASFSNSSNDQMVGNLRAAIGAEAPEGPVKAFLDDWTACQEAHRSHHNWCVYEDLMSLKTTRPDFPRLRKAWDAVLNDYPLLAFTIKVRNHNDRPSNIVARDLALYVRAKSEQLVSKEV